VTWRLPDAARPNALTVEALATCRSLAITLSALDTYYWPQITSTVSHDFPTWRQVMRDFDPAAMQSWLDLSLDQIEKEITSLLTSAAFRDSTGDLYELIRRARQRPGRACVEMRPVRWISVWPPIVSDSPGVVSAVV